MNRLILLLAPAMLLAAPARYARVGEMDGKVDVQIHPADPWSPAERNLTVPENAWLRTAANSRLEVELDEGSTLRLGPDSLVEVSDYTRLSTGQRVTLLSLDHGLAYFTGEAYGPDALSVAFPGGMVMITRGARIRVEAAEKFSRIGVIEGIVKLSFSGADMDLREGQSARIEPGGAAGFSLERDVQPNDLDRWSEGRDQRLAAPASAGRIALKYGVADLDANGQWVETANGSAWKPNADANWMPYQRGRWRWYDSLGYTWVADEPWGWLPYHYGRWLRNSEHGWVWIPSPNPVFKPGEVFWMYGRQFVAWGPLAPGEEWAPARQPQQFQNANLSYAVFVTDTKVIDPAGFSNRPKDPLAAAIFLPALPSPALLPSRLEARRPTLRVGATRPIDPSLAGYDPSAPPPYDPNAAAPPPPADPQPPYDPNAAPPPPPIGYPVPVYPPGVVVVNPPYHPDYSQPNPNRPRNNPTAVPAPQPNPAPAPPPASRGDTTSSQHPAPVNRPGPPVVRTPNAPVSAPPSTPAKVDPPRVVVPPPQHTERPHIDAPPPRIEPPPAPPKVETKPEPKERPKPDPKSEPVKADAPPDRTIHKQ